LAYAGRGRCKYSHNTHSAVFAEVKIDEQLGVIRVTRVVNAVAAGQRESGFGLFTDVRRLTGQFAF